MRKKLKVRISKRRTSFLVVALVILSAPLIGARSVAASAGFSYSPSNPIVNQTVTFRGSCHLPPCDYSWSFGDGTNGPDSQVVTHAYSNAGSYSVHFAVADWNYYEGSQTQTVTVTGVSINGHVFDNSTAAITGATVKMYDQSGNTLYGTATTDSNGYYSINGPSPATYIMWASMPNYWEEKQYVSVSCWGCVAPGDFHLPGDLFYPVANLVVMYDTVNTQQTKADLSWSISAGSSTEVDAYVNPNGVHFYVSTDVTKSGSASTGIDPTIRSLVYSRGVQVHGVFWKGASQPENTFVIAQQNIYGQTTDRVDYMSPPSSGGEIDYVAPHTMFSYSQTQSASFALRYELGVDVSVSLEGIGFSTKLASILLQGSSGVQRSTTIGVTNNDSITHSYEFYFEGGAIAHVWQLN